MAANTPEAYRVFAYGQRVALTDKFYDQTMRYVPAGTEGVVHESHVLRGGYGYSVYLANEDRSIVVRADLLRVVEREAPEFRVYVGSDGQEHGEY
jgi:hypothetical protein